MKNINVSDKKYIVTLFIISVISFFSNIWVREADLMEQRNFITAREMVKNGSYLITTLNGNLRFEKPPLPTWITAFVMKITGNFSDEWVLRIPSAFMGVLMVFFIYYLVKILTDNSNKAFISGFIAATMFMLIKIADENTWDIYTYVTALGSILYLVEGFKKGKNSYYLLSGIFLGFSIMSKGPVGIYGLVIPFIPAYIAAFGWKDFSVNRKKILLTVATAILLSAVWPAIVYFRFPDYFLKVLEKEGNTWSESHKRGFIFYLDYFIYTGVWIFFTLTAFFKNIKGIKKNRYTKFIILWNILIILALSVVNMKKKRYGLPIYMVTALNIGILGDYYMGTVWENLKKYEKYLIYIQGIFIVTVSLGVIFLFALEGFYKKNLSPLYTLPGIVIYCNIVYVFIKHMKNKKSSLGQFILIGSGLFMVFINLSVSWYIDRNFVDRQFKGEFVNSKILQKTPPLPDIYATDYSVDDVWDVGKEIRNLNLKSAHDLPDNFIIFGQVPSMLKRDYKIYKNEIYSENDGDILRLYYMNRKENGYGSKYHRWKPERFSPVDYDNKKFEREKHWEI